MPARRNALGYGFLVRRTPAAFLIRPPSPADPICSRPSDRSVVPLAPLPALHPKARLVALSASDVPHRRRSSSSLAATDDRADVPRRGWCSGWSRLDVAAAASVALVIVTLSVMTYRQQAERTRTVNAANFLAEVHRAQSEFYRTHGRYAERIDDLDLRLNVPVYWDVHPIELSPGSWTIRATRSGPHWPKGGKSLSINASGWVGMHGPAIGSHRRLLVRSAAGLGSSSPVASTNHPSDSSDLWSVPPSHRDGSR